MLLKLVYLSMAFSGLSFLPRTRAADYLLIVMATSEQGYVREVGECAADGASFGRTLGGDDSLTGCFVAASPIDACSTMIPAPTVNASIQCTGGFYAVAARGNCSFAQKAYRAQLANYKGLLVYNSFGSNFPIEMGTDAEFGPSVRIPAFMVGYDCGWAITHSYTFEKKFAFLIRVYWSYHDLLRYLVPFVVVVGVCFSVMVAAMVVKCIRDKRREMRRRLTKRNLKQIPTKKYVKGEDPETCPICLDDFEDNEKLRVLLCGHAYHCKCIDPWLLKTRRVCPICKRKVLPGRDDSSDSDDDDGPGPSRLASASERTPLLVQDGESGMSVGNSTFYGAYDRSDSPPDGSANPTPPMNRGRPMVLTPASTPEVEDQRFTVESDSREPLINVHDHNVGDESRPDHPHSDGHVNPNFVADASSLTINADSVPRGEAV